MTIDEAIERELNIAHKGSDCWKHCSNTKKHCKDCMEEHEQLAEWLEELKAYREIGTVEECKESVLDIEKSYNKAIDDFAEKLKEMANNSSTKYIRLSEKETIVTYGVEQIVKQLKGDGENE